MCDITEFKINYLHINVYYKEWHVKYSAYMKTSSVAEQLILGQYNFIVIYLTLYKQMRMFQTACSAA